MEDFLRFLFDLLTLRSRKPGPLVVRVDIDAQRVHLTLENQGKRRLGFAAVRCQGGDRQKHFPQVELAPNTALRPGQPETVTIPTAELRSIRCQQLAILDTQGNVWPVEGFDAAALGAPSS